MRRPCSDRYTAPMHPLSRQAGVTLVEVLLASALAGFALLALAMLHTQSLRSLDHAQRAVTANFLLNDLASRMQANPAGRATYVSLIGGSPASQGCSSTHSADAATPCLPAALAQHDLYVWKAMATTSLGSLPSAPTLTELSATDTSYRATLNWKDQDETRSASLAFRLRPSIP